LLLAALGAAGVWGANYWLRQNLQPVFAQLGWPQARLVVTPALSGIAVHVYPDAAATEPLLSADFSPYALWKNMQAGEQVGNVTLKEGVLNYGDHVIPFGPVALAGSVGKENGQYVITGQGKLAGNPFTLQSDFTQAGNGGAEIKFDLADMGTLLTLVPSDLQSAFTEVSASGTGSARWQMKEWQPLAFEPDGEFALEKAAFTYNDIKVEGVKGRFALTHNKDGQWQLASVKDITIDRVNLAVPAEQIKLQLKLNNSRINVLSGSAKVLGGTISTQPTVIALPFNSIKADLTATALDLTQILALGKLDGLRGDGKLSGTIPLTYQKGTLVLRDAVLTTDGPGQVAYAPAEPPAFMAEGGQAAIVGQVFNDFRYKSITLKLNGTFGQDLAMITRLEGMNPNFYSGHPVAFNLNLTGALDSVLRQGMATANLTAGDLSDMMKMEGTPP